MLEPPLQGNYVHLERLAPHHYPVILAGLEPDIFTYMNPDVLRDSEALRSGAISLPEARKAFALVSGAYFAGSTSFYVLSEANRTFEIGNTWVKKVYQGTKVNTEAKYLLLEYLFESCHAIRVQIRTHNANACSKRAIEKLGLIQEGVIRNESIFKDGSLRDTALYSAITSEWPGQKVALRSNLYGNLHGSLYSENP